MSTVTDLLDNEELAHHGVLGMKWGIRRRSSGGKLVSTPAGAQPGQPHKRRAALAALASGHKKHISEDSITYHQLRKKAKAHSVHSLTNEEIRKLTTRHDLEKKFAKMQEEQKLKKDGLIKRHSKAQIGKLLTKIGDTAINTLGDAAGKNLGAHAVVQLGKKGPKILKAPS